MTFQPKSCEIWSNFTKIIITATVMRYGKISRKIIINQLSLFTVALTFFLLMEKGALNESTSTYCKLELHSLFFRTFFLSGPSLNFYYTGMIPATHSSNISLVCIGTMGSYDGYISEIEITGVIVQTLQDLP